MEGEGLNVYSHLVLFVLCRCIELRDPSATELNPLEPGLT